MPVPIPTLAPASIIRSAPGTLIVGLFPRLKAPFDKVRSLHPELRVIVTEKLLPPKSTVVAAPAYDPSSTKTWLDASYGMVTSRSTDNVPEVEVNVPPTTDKVPFTSMAESPPEKVPSY